MVDDDVIFSEHAWASKAGGKMLLYFGPNLKENLNRVSVREFLRRRKAWGAVWNYDWDCEDGGPWYTYVCDTIGYDIDKITSKNSRKTIRRSLERNEVRRVDAAWLADHGYEMYVRATARYKNYKVASREGFAREVRALGAETSVLIYGVFADGVLAAYGIARQFGPTVRFIFAHFDPDRSETKPMYALYYTLARDCLNQGCTDIDAGWRPFVHDTNIEEFFRRMGWRQAPCRIDLYLAWPLRAVLSIARIIREPLDCLLPGRFRVMLQGLLVAEDVARESRRRPAVFISRSG
ncbi:MAG TPA: GNAT family N-acetyltransferase [Phycisphaerae bacterium]|nr:GNAT family N-acetyltransferase [Phycisphaerae bacterium]HNU46418.1 GNAT family N-acetyltransferase [Phycisphaerae bacterium]